MSSAPALRPGLRHFYPRAVVRVTAILSLSLEQDATTQVTFLVDPRSVRIERNDFNTADIAEIEIDASRFPVLPRMIRQALVQVYAGDALGVGPDAIDFDDAFVRFIGYVDSPEMSLNDMDGTIRWKARDYTALLLDVKRPSVDIVPRYTDSLEDALRRILDSVPGGDSLGLRLLIDGVESTEWPTLSDGAPPGLAEARMPVKPDWTAWHLVKAACDPAALIPSFELDTLVVRSSRGLLPPSRRPAFIYGENLQEFKETRDLGKLREGIGLVGYSVVDRSSLYAVFPPPGDSSIAKSQSKVGKVATTKNGKPKGGKVVKSSAGARFDANDKRKWFPFGAVASQEALDGAAEQIWRRRSRGEFEGSFKCARMVVPDDTAAEVDYDVTGLASGDRVMLDVLPEHRAILGRYPSSADREAALVDVGYEQGVATALVAVYEAGLDSPREVYVRRATHAYSEGEGYTLTVDYANLIDGSVKP